MIKMMESIQPYECDKVIVQDDDVIFNGQQIGAPRKRKRIRTLYANNGRICIDGFEYKDGKWKRTLWALLHS